MSKAPNTDPEANTTGRPLIPWTTTEAGYGPMLVYRDSSPLFDSSPVFQNPDAQANGTDIPIESQDYAAFVQMIEFSQQRNLNLIFVEIPWYDHPEIYQGIMNQLETYTRQQNIPFLTTASMPNLPASAYADRTHLHVTGSTIFSQWLGEQIGHAVLKGVLSDGDSPIWSPVSKAWPEPAYLSTLGLSENGYKAYLGSSSNFNLIPRDAVLFNPGEEKLNNQYLQSLIGFDIDQKVGLSNLERENLFQFMTVLDRMRYQDDLQLASGKATQLENWRKTLAPSILADLGIQYVLCRVELAVPGRQHCPNGIETDPNYLTVAAWNLDPMYEKYFLYKVITQ
jgi:hypothetical protein